jgi:RNase P/RNase MRP subunit POP5
VNGIIKGPRRHRYISFHITANEHIPSFSPSDILFALRKQSVELFSIDIKALGFWLVRFDGTIGIAKCRLKEKDRTKQLLVSLKKIRSTPVTITTSATSGTIRSLTQRSQKDTK